MSKDELKSKALQLRRKGLSYNQISKKLGVSKSTVSLWLAKVGWSVKMIDVLAKQNKTRSRAQLRSYAKIRKVKMEAMREVAREEARQSFFSLSKNILFLVGLTIYWGEGDKRMANGLVRISNIDPAMVKKFIEFLRKVCEVPQERIKIWLLLYKDLNEIKCKRYWTTKLNLRPSQFVKSQCIVGRHKTRRVSYGVCNLYVSNRLLKEKILTWIELLGRM
ncbi:MAG: hypothetical protein A3J93_05410 [Candidatus Magasanikbacteria bacterium RIFOXYC2_FULL_42_28]|uniref:Uncharacterized protein n=1 Tax=Candidatus Magasanikbacteria bacterium RIFOXYC2_FULL_42_28 TaxID=1798704 RepID=A0A1F6NVE9_9BACT|nr:MAG: hypothetical protein A3J93_05410 [Candidatus Magasanikbacteria bacterium RIFOXYC2_FULL_42_28]